jgi:hypothetical protein
MDSAAASGSTPRGADRHPDQHQARSLRNRRRRRLVSRFMPITANPTLTMRTKTPTPGPT